MKTRSIFIFLCLLSLSTSLYSQNAEPAAVVELFTSEGCSSCPAADELLKEMAVKRENEGKPFIALAFHITYWNHLGWADPYSNEVYTDRQKKYAVALKHPQFYTPQAVINGVHQFVGSDEVAFRDSLEKAERRKPSFYIEARAMQRGDSIEVQYTLNKDSKNHLLNIAVVEKNSERKITRGENKSRTLRHFNVVREFKTLESKKQGTIMLSGVKDLTFNNMEIVLYVQHKKTMRIVGASRISMSE